MVSNGKLIPNGTETIMAKHEGEFPKYEHLIPAQEREGQVTTEIDPALMVKLLKAFKGVSKVRIYMVSDKDALRFDGNTDDGLKVVGVLMPIVKK